MMDLSVYNYTFVLCLSITSIDLIDPDLKNYNERTYKDQLSRHHGDTIEGPTEIP